jgi:membrane protease YdiL (CAAX protease family)
MSDGTASAVKRKGVMKKHPLLLFFIITFAITWGLGALIMIFPAQFEAAFGELDLNKPSYKAIWHLAVYGPAISAFVVIALIHGVAGVKAYLRRFLHWRAGAGWYAFVLVGVPGVHICGRLIFSALGGTPPPYEFDPWYMMIPMSLLGLLNDPGPVEELGWRGFALPLLQKKFSALSASIILGFIWGIWHLPAFYISATPQSTFSLPFFILGTVSNAIIMTALYNGTRGCIPLAFLFHWQINNAFGFSIFPEGEWISFVSFAAVALIFIVILGPRNLGRAKCTEVVSLETEGEAGL